MYINPMLAVKEAAAILIHVRFLPIWMFNSAFVFS
jgi:hypothetical protein